MKKWTIYLTLLALTAALSGCGSTMPETTTRTTTAPTVTTTPTVTTAPSTASTTVPSESTAHRDASGEAGTGSTSTDRAAD